VKVEEVVFALLGVVAVGAGVLVVTTKQLVHAALWLVVSFGALAGGYLMLTAEFVAWVQVLIYVGAVVVLLLFGIMLTRAPIGRSDDLNSGNRIPALVVALATAGLLVTVLVRGFRDAQIRPCGEGWFGHPPVHQRCLATGGTSSTLGAAIFRSWVLPFEVLSVLLLAALVGAIMLSRRGNSETDARGQIGRDGRGHSGPHGRGRTGTDARGGTGADAGGATGTEAHGATGADARGGAGANVRDRTGTDARGGTGRTGGTGGVAVEQGSVAEGGSD
jgi:NADH-quinone oxidoreductase subunit J